MRRGEFPSFVATKVLEGRKAMGIEQRDLADLAKVTYGDVRRLERGRGSVDALVLAAVTRVLGLSLDDVVPFQLWRTSKQETVAAVQPFSFEVMDALDDTEVDIETPAPINALADAGLAAGGRPTTLSQRDMLRERKLQDLVTDEDAEVEIVRPKTRAECVGGPRPCPFVSCRHHLYLDVTRNGSIKFNHPGAELEQLAETCALDVADRGGSSLKAIGRLLNITNTGVEHIEELALKRIAPRSAALAEFIDWDPTFTETPLAEGMRRK